MLWTPSKSAMSHLRRKNKTIAFIHQGRFDTENELLTLRENALRLNNVKALDAVNMRLKKVFPKISQRLVGPLYDRKRDKRFQCYCNVPKSLYAIHLDILSGKVPTDALTCDACWQEDLATTWGYYGWASKEIPIEIWKALCAERGDDKFAYGS